MLLIPSQEFRSIQILPEANGESGFEKSIWQSNGPVNVQSRKESYMALGFDFYTPTKIVFGKGSSDRIGELLKEQGSRKTLVVYGSGSVVRSGLLERVLKKMDETGISHCELGGVVPNPRLSKVYEGINLARKEGVDFILAVGGGSVIDTAKAISYGLADDGDVWDFYEHTRQAKACYPVGSILTIAAAGSETSDGSVITNDKTDSKRAFGTDFGRPKFAVMDPELTMTLPDYQTMSGATDIMMHTMERYFTCIETMEITDAIAEGLMRVVMKHAKILHEEPKNYESRSEMMWSGSLAHNGLTGIGTDGGDWSCHQLEHEVGGMFDVAHGAGLAAVWGSWARYVWKDAPDRFVNFAIRVHGVMPGADTEETVMKGIQAQEDFYRSIGMPTSLSELGVSPTDEQKREMAKRCFAACGGPQGSVKKLQEEDMYQIYCLADH